MLGLRGVEPNAWPLGSLGVCSLTPGALCDITEGLICAKIVCDITGVLVERQQNLAEVTDGLFFSVESTESLRMIRAF